jgi:xylitol oxidase
VELVRADGRLDTVRRGDPEFAGSVVALGAAGIVTALELATVPASPLAQWVREDVPLDVLPLDAARSVSAFTRTWERFDQVWFKGAPGAVPHRTSAGPRGAAAHDRRRGPRELHAPARRAGPVVRAAAPTSGRVPAQQRGELQSEYLVARADAAAALAAVRALRERIAPVLLVSEIRSVAADDLWLSPAHGRDSLAIHFTWRPDPAGVLPVVGAVEAALDPFDPRPHWGKVFTTPAGRLAELYPACRTRWSCSAGTTRPVASATRSWTGASPSGEEPQQRAPGGGSARSTRQRVAIASAQAFAPCRATVCPSLSTVSSRAPSCPARETPSS